MGVFDFVKSAGEKLLDLSPGMKAAEILVEQVRKHKLGKGDVKVEQSGDTVKISGTASSQADKEKMILAVGNVNGVARVEDDIIIIDPSDQGPAAQPPSRNPGAAAPAPAAVRALEAAAAAATEAPAQFYTVVKGDTLSKISKQFYGSAQKYNRIFEANRPLLQHPDKIYPGQTLRIPPAV
ncbi:MAG: LysM and BON domain-containing protein [Chiayiivirga sp.]|jgi:nucleoid-associated protein YgaU|uniref:LysM and BON domain-containing protein n=1 Tax=Chiayiivirga sp. TaxID=2041042 RepID=UPI0031BE54F1|nr:LysM and BON domain-containing protein [Chiayiivirga sp.]MCI1728356.1 LysM and BON domain-containing protein [Chiayiivirga sp.]